MPHQYLPETLALIEQAERDIAAEKATDTTAVDNQQLGAIFAHLQANQRAAEQSDPQWAGPSLPHPTEVTSDEEHTELAEGWDNWQRGLDGEAAEL